MRYEYEVRVWGTSVDPDSNLHIRKSTSYSFNKTCGSGSVVKSVDSLIDSSEKLPVRMCSRYTLSSVKLPIVTGSVRCSIRQTYSLIWYSVLLDSSYSPDPGSPFLKDCMQFNTHYNWLRSVVASPLGEQTTCARHNTGQVVPVVGYCGMIRIG